MYKNNRKIGMLLCFGVYVYDYFIISYMIVLCDVIWYGVI
jgi:hypothetical protein